MSPAFMIDNREPAWIQKLALGGAPVAVMMLDAGDVHIACDDGALVVVERKTPDDLLSSIADGRIFAQVARMLEISRFTYVVVTGEIRPSANGYAITERGETGWNFTSVQGALLSMQELGAMIFTCNGDDAFEHAVMTIASRKHKAMPIRPARAAELLSPAATVLCSLPSIGPERAHAALDHCGSGAWALATLTQPTERIPGVPPAATQNIRTALGLKQDEILAVLTQE